MKKKIGTPQILRCSFCGRGQDEVTKLISGPSVYICNECIALCNEILAEDEEREVGIRAVAAAVLDPGGYPVAALCIGAPAFRVPHTDLVHRLAPIAIEGAREIAARLYALAAEGNEPREIVAT